ncbi:MAG: hypothetical protein KF893_10740 [Caldilineaceae bacterium]|nr:hypothetical protein [Caldilineaceae bacterium]
MPWFGVTTALVLSQSQHSRHYNSKFSAKANRSNWQALDKNLNAKAQSLSLREIAARIVSLTNTKSVKICAICDPFFSATARR